MNILVLCTGNSARSILLEALLNDLGKGRVRAFSAGSQPAGQVHPQSLAQLEREGLPTADLHSKSWDTFAAAEAPEMQVVITVCGSAAAETCPLWPGAPVSAHWGVEDPAAAEGTALEPAFETAFATLKRRAARFLAEPVEQMTPADLRAHLDQCGEIS